MLFSLLSAVREGDQLRSTASLRGITQRGHKRKMPTSAPQRDHYCFIIHDNLPYCYDINSILALPAGFRYRNRFNAPWVEPNLHDNISAVVDADVLIVLRVQEDNVLVPVRWGTIQVAQQVGSIYYFEYILGDLIRYSERPADRAREMSQATSLFSDTHVWLPGTRGVALSATEPSVFRSVVGRRLPKESAGDLTAWGNSVAA